MGRESDTSVELEIVARRGFDVVSRPLQPFVDIAKLSDLLVGAAVCCRPAISTSKTL